MPAPIAYWHPHVSAPQAKGHPAFARIQCAGPWSYKAPAEGGTLATLLDWPDAGEHAPARLDAYQPAGEPDDQGLRCCLPLGEGRPELLYQLIRNDRSGTDIELACGVMATVPEALSRSSQLQLTTATLGPPVTEYGSLAHQLHADALEGKGLAIGEPRLLRLFELAFAQRYRPMTREYIDWLQIFSVDDVDPLLGVIWYADPKALEPVAAGDPSDSPSSAPTGSNSRSEKPTTSSAGADDPGASPHGVSD